MIGALLRIKRAKQKIGILIVHSGIGLMLISGLVTFLFSVSGHMTLYEKDQSDSFKSYYEWEVSILRSMGNGEFSEYGFEDQEFEDIDPGQQMEFYQKDLPFEVHITEYMRNCQVMAKDPVFDVF